MLYTHITCFPHQIDHILKAICSRIRVVLLMPGIDGIPKNKMMCMCMCMCCMFVCVYVCIRVVLLMPGINGIPKNKTKKRTYIRHRDMQISGL